MTPFPQSLCYSGYLSPETTTSSCSLGAEGLICESFMWFFMIMCYALSVASILSLAATGLQGVLRTRLDIGLQFSHINMALIAIILYLFTEVLIMFFFIGTGSSIKEYVRTKGIDSALYDRVKQIKHRLFPGTMLNMGLVSLAFILGGAVHRSGLPSWIHGVVFLLAFAHLLKTKAVQNGCFRDNIEIVQDMVAER